MTKKPTTQEEIEDFVRFYNEFDSNPKAITNIMSKYKVVNKTAYNWVEMFIRHLSSNKKAFKPNTMQELMLKYIYGIKERSDDYRIADISLDNVGDGILVVCMSDFHVGSKFTDLGHLMSDVELIRETENVYAFMLGDYTDIGPISSTHKSLLHDQIMSYGEQRKIVRSIFDEIGFKTLALTTGCHGAWYFNENGEYYEEELAELTLTKAFLYHGGTVNLRVGEQIYKIFLTHKTSGASKLNPTRGLFKLHEQGMDFDLAVGAHNHTPATQTLWRRGKDVTCIKCGSYKGLDTYASKTFYSEGPRRIPGVFLSAKSRVIIPFLNWRDGLYLVKKHL